MSTKNRLSRFLRASTLQSRGTRLLAVASFIGLLDPFVSQVSPSTHLIRLVRGSVLETVLTGGVIFLLVEVLFFQHRTDTADAPQKSPSATFAAATIEFARHLKATRSHGPLLALRDNSSHLLHLLRAHRERIELGRLALPAAVETKSDIHRALILIDDLGWASSEAGDTAEARRNITKGIAITQAAVAGDPLEIGRLKLARAKGLRHLAMLSTSDSEAMDYLGKARGELATLRSDQTLANLIGDDVARDEAQIKHAEASVLARGLDLANEASRPIFDENVLRAAGRAIAAGEEAASMFELIRDDERHAKALMLVEKVQRRLGLEVDAIETNARIRRVLRALGD